ncbi:hypothetical protein APE_0867b [Aeropyrum pernix spindle-shaped virus 1]|uniref:Uncharacterized protein n=1 Tax=Aeropyrum pernix (strain ATCC 700893 / DSM 11879 / JCM 9820 / NBRC 100138 / K1) TaxID=272557 RepID=Q9YDP7_AERPE|nr:hypothetical protein APE_0867b [Aeropyrum pernix spindle-shaped virus 1] [Aeropyrum pernix K1]
MQEDRVGGRLESPGGEGSRTRGDGRFFSQVGYKILKIMNSNVRVSVCVFNYLSFTNVYFSLGCSIGRMWNTDKRLCLVDCFNI